MDNKIKVLWYSDFLRHTGFGNVAEEIISRLMKTGDYEFEIIGINYSGEPHNWPEHEYYKFKDIKVWPAMFLAGDNLFCQKRLLDLVVNSEYDILFSMQDAFNMVEFKDYINRNRIEKNFRYIFYFPIDGDIKTEWVTSAIQIADFPVTYSDFGVSKVKGILPALTVDKIPHGIDLEVFKPFENTEDREKFRKEYFNVEPDEFLIGNINRNQPRKDLPRSMIAFSEFCKRYPDYKVRLYLHCLPEDRAGHNINDIARKYMSSMSLNKITSPDPRLIGKNGFPTAKMAKIYAGLDMVTSTTLGEGWGLSTTEAMACKVPVVMPNNSALSEIVGNNEERGYLVKSGATVNQLEVFKFDNELLRPLTDIEDLILKWKHVMDNKQEAQNKAEKAHIWLQDYGWDQIAMKWDALFKKAYESKLNI